MQTETNLWKPAFLITDAPDGWLKQSVDKNTLLLSNKEILLPHKKLTRHWENTTGVKTSDSKFTVTVPIHNEEKSLMSSVGALILSQVPVGVDMQTNFILNGCDDNSEGIINNLLKRIGNVVVHNIPESEYRGFNDANLERTFLEVRQGKLIYRVYKTETKGKANALKLGNSLAILSNHEILISVDANNYVEPDTLMHMFKEAYSHFIKENDETVVLSAIPKKVHKNTLRIMEKLLREHGIYDDAKYIPVYGWCMAFKTSWAHENIQPVAVEDYALGIMARSQNKKVAVVENALIWGYRTTFKDSLNQFRRSIRGRLQLLNLHPELKSIMESDNYFMRSLPERINVIYKHISLDPKSFLKYMWRFIYGEVGLVLGKYDYKCEPTNQSWDKLTSTK
ncbi:MAG: hypothetical protein ACD_19C00176G0046 [uncultured bacterium]|nr:MAG: hypothetical protein ACD_19C00176G0046 [uncultured bacterium]